MYPKQPQGFFHCSKNRAFWNFVPIWRREFSPSSGHPIDMESFHTLSIHHIYIYKNLNTEGYIYIIYVYMYIYIYLYIVQYIPKARILFCAKAQSGHPKTDVQTAFSDQSINPFPINHGFRPPFDAVSENDRWQKNTCFRVKKPRCKVGCCWNLVSNWWHDLSFFLAIFFGRDFFDWVKDRLFSGGLNHFCLQNSSRGHFDLPRGFCVGGKFTHEQDVASTFLKSKSSNLPNFFVKVARPKKSPKISTVVLKDGSPILYLAILRSCSFWDG